MAVVAGDAFGYRAGGDFKPEIMIETGDLATAVGLAMRHPLAPRAVESTYRRIQVETALRQPICIASGKCCRFETYGHRLFLTTMELAVFGIRLAGQNLPPRQTPWDRSGCPFQAGKLCGVHAIRPMGCRLFYCDPTSTQWQQSLYERMHARMKRLHRWLQIPYCYVEWRTALRLLDWDHGAAALVSGTKSE